MTGATALPAQACASYVAPEHRPATSTLAYMAIGRAAGAARLPAAPPR